MLWWVTGTAVSVLFTRLHRVYNLAYSFIRSSEEVQSLIWRFQQQFLQSNLEQRDRVCRPDFQGKAVPYFCCLDQVRFVSDEGTSSFNSYYSRICGVSVCRRGYCDPVALARTSAVDLGTLPRTIVPRYLLPRPQITSTSAWEPEV